MQATFIFIKDFFMHPFFGIASGIVTLVSIIGILYLLYLTIKGVIPVWYRLGKSLSKREIAVFADEKFAAISDSLLNSNLFNKSNIIQVDKHSIEKASGMSIFIVHYLPYKEKMAEILAQKSKTTALIVYSPINEDRIENEVLENLDNRLNTTIVNFRGRLLNDVLVGMITTAFIK